MMIRPLACRETIADKSEGTSGSGDEEGTHNAANMVAEHGDVPGQEQLTEVVTLENVMEKLQRLELLVTQLMPPKCARIATDEAEDRRLGKLEKNLVYQPGH